MLDDYGTIGGGLGNVVGIDDDDLNNQAVATVGGGSNNIASGVAATVGGGANNTAIGSTATVGGGSFNTSSSNATVGGGYSNTASGFATTVGGGFGNTASNLYSTVGGGVNNTASGSNATVPGGVFADASHYGEMAYASGRFANTGDAQTSLYVLRQETSDANLTELFLNEPFERITLAADRVLTFDILVVGSHRFGGGSSAGYQVTGVIKNIGGTTSFVGTPVVTTLAEDVVGWDVEVMADNSLDALVVKVRGSSGTSIRWVASVRTVEVGR